MLKGKGREEKTGRICLIPTAEGLTPVSISLLGYAPSFLGDFSHDTIVVAPSHRFPNVLKSCDLVLFSWRKINTFHSSTDSGRNPGILEDSGRNQQESH